MNIKKIILFILIAIPTLVYAQDGIKFKCAWKTYFIVPENGTLIDKNKSILFSNEDMDVKLEPVKLGGTGIESFIVYIKNKTENKISIILNESSYILNGESVPVADAETLVMNMTMPQADWSIPPHSMSKKQLCQKVDSQQIINFGGEKECSLYLTFKNGDKTENSTLKFNIVKKNKK